MIRILILVCLCLAVPGCAPEARDVKRGDDNSIIRLSGSDARSLDPQMVADMSSIEIATDQFEGLTRLNGSGQPEPGLATRWDVSADGLIWDFKLRGGLVFSDGEPINPDVFVKALARTRDEAGGSPHAALFAAIERIESPQPDVVRVILEQPFPQLPALLVHPAMAALPFHIIDKAGDGWTAQRPLVTSGPYRLTDWKLAQQITLESNPKWHGGKPRTPKVIWRPIEDAQSAMRLMLAGGGDISGSFPASRLQWLQENHGDLVHISDSLGTYYYVFDMREPPFDDVRVRRALSIAVDREWIATNMIAAGNAPAYGFIPPALRGGTLPPPPGDTPERQRQARQLLKQAGYDAANPLRFEIRFNSSPEHRRTATAMATMWRDIGVDAQLLNSEASLHFDALRRADFAMARSGWIADLPAPENFLSIYTIAAGPQNYPGYANAEYETALKHALAEQDTENRATLMRHAEQILLADVPFIPLYYYNSRSLVQPDIIGWEANTSGAHPSRLIYRKKR